MVQRITYWVDYNERLDEWAVMKSGRASNNFHTVATYRTKKDATNYARQAAKSEELPSKLKVERKNSFGLSEESNYNT